MDRMARMKKSLILASSALLAGLLILACLTGCGGEAATPREGTPPRALAEFAGTRVARVGGQSSADVAAAAVLAVFSDPAHQPRGLVLTPQDDWKQVLVAAQFAADPVNAAVVPTAVDYLPTAPSDLVARLNPGGFPRAQGVQALVLGRAGDDVFSALQNRGLHLTQLKAGSVEALAAKAVPFRGGWGHSYSDEVLVVSSEARDYALPAAAWSAFSGDTVAFVTNRGVPNETRGVLVQRQKLRLEKPTIYLIGPPAVIPDSIATELRAYGNVKRVAGDTPEATAVALARYKDPKTGFGWGLRSSPGTVSVVNARDWANVFGALAFAAAGPRAPLLLTRSANSAPPTLVAYLRELRGHGQSQAFVFGDETSVSRSQFIQIDRELNAP
jgi:hypothetical protein